MRVFIVTCRYAQLLINVKKNKLFCDQSVLVLILDSTGLFHISSKTVILIQDTLSRTILCQVDQIKRSLQMKVVWETILVADEKKLQTCFHVKT